jgi:DNA-binding transcriptional ArsR family regulator
MRPAGALRRERRRTQHQGQCKQKPGKASQYSIPAVPVSQTLGELCAQLDMSRQAVTKHLAVLEKANLVVTVWRGREKLHYLNPEPIEGIAERWIGKYERRRVQALRDLKKALEDEDHG